MLNSVLHIYLFSFLACTKNSTYSTSFNLLWVSSTIFLSDSIFYHPKIWYLVLPNQYILYNIEVSKTTEI